MAAAQGQFWLRDGYGGDFHEPPYRTQARWIDRASRLLGISAETEEAEAEAIARLLGVSGMEHVRARRQVSTSDRLLERGRAIVGVLEKIGLDEAVGGRLLAAGHRAGLWGEPSLWSPRLGRRLSAGPGTVALGLAPRPP